jgi:hypothetical protein
VLLVELPRAPYGGLIVILFSFTNIKKKKKKKGKRKASVFNPQVFDFGLKYIYYLLLLLLLFFFFFLIFFLWGETLSIKVTLNVYLPISIKLIKGIQILD